MDRAIVVCAGREKVITAGKYESEGYRFQSDYSRQAYCPICRQPVTFASGPSQSPHFRHERKNPLAQWCELFSSNNGGDGAQYERIPPPLYIRQRRGSDDVFVVELGLKRVKDSVLGGLEAECAALVVSDARSRKRKYAISRERFGGGMLRIPLMISTSYSFVELRLTGTKRQFKDVWGPLNSIGNEVVFLCDQESLSGRRVESWGHLSFGDSLLIASASSLERLKQSFPDAECVGCCDSPSPQTALNVYLATVGAEAAGFIERHSFVLSPMDDTPEVLWPPSLTSTGETIPLFAKSDCAFKVRATNDEKGRLRTRLYVHSRFDARQSSTEAMERTYGADWMLSRVAPVSDIRFLSTRDWIFSNAILLGFKEDELTRRLIRLNENPRIEGPESGTYTLEVLCSSEVQVLRRGGGGESFTVDPGVKKRVTLKRGELLRVYLRSTLEKAHGKRLLTELALSKASHGERHAEESELQHVSEAFGLGHDRCFAELRLKLQRPVLSASDLKFAEARKGLK